MLCLVLKKQNMPDLYRSFPQKSPIIRGSFAKRDLRLKAFYATWPPCTSALLFPLFGRTSACVTESKSKRELDIPERD